MRHLRAAVAALGLCAATSLAADIAAVEGFEKDQTLPTPWIVGAPNEAVSAALSSDQKSEGKQSLQIGYTFTTGVQYLGVPVPVNIDTPVRKLMFQMRGDKSGSGLGVYITDASDETHKFRAVGQPKIDFDGWKQITVDLTAGHETWGGDKNGKINYPITKVTFEIGTPGHAVDGRVFFDDLRADREGAVDEAFSGIVAVDSPAYRAEIQGATPITFTAKGFKTVTARSWKQGGRFGSSALIAKVELGADGKGTFNFPADDFPHGPITITLTGEKPGATDNCYLQLYNKGGVKWNVGAPADAPAAAKGLTLLFTDDFDGPLSIGNDPAKHRYYDHKPPRGETDFSSTPFVSHDKPNTPFAQMDSFLRIRASDKAKSAGIISSLHSEGEGFMVKAPAYFECRFIGPNAIGSWPAFWLMTDHMSNGQHNDKRTPCDELDIIEAYGGEGPKSPNAFDKFMISPHCWNQGDAGHEVQEKAVKQLKRPTEMSKAGIPSTWYEAPHTYGCLVTETDTVYYVDDIEVGRHATLPLCKEKPLFFMINLATGGGWPVDLSRYGGEIDMYVDYVRVYGKK